MALFRTDPARESPIMPKPADGLTRDFSFVHVSADEYKRSHAEVDTSRDSLHQIFQELAPPQDVARSNAQASHKAMMANEQELGFTKVSSGVVCGDDAQDF